MLHALVILHSRWIRLHRNEQGIRKMRKPDTAFAASERVRPPNDVLSHWIFTPLIESGVKFLAEA